MYAMQCVKSLLEHVDSLQQQCKRAVQQSIATWEAIGAFTPFDSLPDDFAWLLRDHITRTQEARKVSEEREEVLSCHASLI